MKKFETYDREAAVAYAKKWALGRNPAYKDYELLGGDCTNYISQSLHAGGIPFDHNGEEYKKWYWYSDGNRTPSWTSAELLHVYIMANNNQYSQNHGIYARPASYNELELGDLVQLIYNGNAYHTMIVTDIVLEGEYVLDYLISQHTYNLLDYPLSMKVGERRYIKILGYYK